MESNYKGDYFIEITEVIFKSIFENYKRPLLFFAQSILKHKKPDAEEIVLDVFLKLWERRKCFTNEMKVKAFLYISVKNACFTLINSAYITRHQFEEELDSFEQFEDPEVIVNLIRADTLQQISAKFNTLPPMQRKILTMSFVEENDAQEIANILKISSNSVYVNYSRGIQSLKKKLKNKKDWFFLFFL